MPLIQMRTVYLKLSLNFTAFGRWIASVAAIAVLVITSPALSAAIPPEPASTALQLEAMLGRMTLPEKLGQLTLEWGGRINDTNPQIAQSKTEELHTLIREGKIGAFLGAHGAAYTNELQKIAVEGSRLGIPLLFGNDVIHGYNTIFPIPLAEACTWSPELVEAAAAAAAAEARASGTRWTFAPMVDIARDPRWGRVAEGSGEDPYLGSVMAAARVRGFQGDDPFAADKVLACAKHYVAYGAAEGGRDYNTVDLSRRTLREIYLPPFQAAVEAGVGSIMSAFNEINGVPATANRFALTDVLRGEWNFDGFVVSDYNSVGELVPHGYADSPARAAALAILAGVDMDMCSKTYSAHLQEMTQDGTVSDSVINEAVRRVLRSKLRIGLFQQPYADPAVEASLRSSQAHQELALSLARSSIVLLKNEGNLLPLRTDLRTLAVIGPLADDTKNPHGTWAGIGAGAAAVTVLEAIKARVSPETSVRFVKGCDLAGVHEDDITGAVAVASKADAVVLVVGEPESYSGEAHCRTNLQLPGTQLDLVKGVHRTGVPTIVVLMNGRPLSVAWTAEHVPALVEAWHLGAQSGNAVADVLFGKFNPAGKLAITIPRNVGQVPIYYNHKNTGRPPSEDRWTSKYLDTPWTPLFPFGFGLSYTEFAYSDLRISPLEADMDDNLVLSATIRNKGDRAGHEVVQLYFRDIVASITRPVKELKGFRRIWLEPGQATRVEFSLPVHRLGFYNSRSEYVVEPGRFKVWIGPNSVNGLEGALTVQRR